MRIHIGSLRYLSLFDGIGAASVAWAPLGWELIAKAEIEKFPIAVTDCHLFGVPNLGDVTRITEQQIAALGHLNLIVFGSPCQDLSVAGKRAGLQGERSGLFHDAMRIIRWARLHCGLRFALWENVPGAFSSNKGADFGVVVGELAGVADVEVPPRGWGTEGAIVGPEALVEWSTLDAQWFGVAQRRRRVFALADFGDWTRRPPILLEPESLRGNSAPRREAGQGVAHPLESRAGGGGFPGTDGAADGHVVAEPRVEAFGGNNTGGAIDVATACNAKSTQRNDFESETFIVGEPLPFDTTQVTSKSNYSSPKPGDPCHPLAHGQHAPAIAFQSSQSGVRVGDTHATLDSHNGSRRHHGVVDNRMQVRRLTPRECERLQAFKDDYTLIPVGKRMAKDGPRYKALGNSMCVNVMRWIGEQMDLALWCEGRL